MRLIVIVAVWVAFATQVTSKELRVAVDIAPVQSIVAQVMGAYGRLNLIVPVGASPHDNAMRPSEAQNLNKADVVIWVGEGLTPWLKEPIATLATDARRLELLNLPQTKGLPFREGALFGAHSHQEDDSDLNVDPHVWLDPMNAIAWAHVIAEVLGEEDPDRSLIYKKNAAIFENNISEAIADIETQVEPVIGRPFVVYHDAFYGFEHRFGLEAIGAISDGDAAAPSPKRVAQVRDLVRSKNVRCILAEPLFNEGLVNAVAGNARVGVVDPMGAGSNLGPDLYEDLLRSIGKALVDCLAD